jgi:hypothetical protein
LRERKTAHGEMAYRKVVRKAVRRSVNLREAYKMGKTATLLRAAMG